MGLLPRRVKVAPVAPGEGFGDECREAFLRLCAERDAINLNEPTKRSDNGKKWLKKQTAINDVLDRFNDWRASRG